MCTYLTFPCVSFPYALCGSQRFATYLFSTSSGNCRILCGSCFHTLSAKPCYEVWGQTFRVARRVLISFYYCSCTIASVGLVYTGLLLICVCESTTLKKNSMASDLRTGMRLLAMYSEHSTPEIVSLYLRLNHATLALCRTTITFVGLLTPKIFALWVRFPTLGLEATCSVLLMFRLEQPPKWGLADE